MNGTTSNALRGRPLIFGEVLFDQFPDGSAVLGGAPFNVAWHLRGLGLDPLFVSRIGDDANGAQVSEAMAAWELDRSGLQLDPAKPTGQVSITLHGKDARFDIRADQAYDHIDPAALDTLLQGQGVSMLYHGSLIARTAGSRRTLERLAAGGDLPVFVDVNLRDPWWDLPTLSGILQSAHWLKLNDDELLKLAPGAGADTESLMRAAADLRRRYGLGMVIVTRGPDGALIDSEQGSTSAPAPPPRAIVDTVGAGDSFSAVAIYGLHQGWTPETILRRALAFASTVCEQRGATGMAHELYTGAFTAWDSE